MTIEKTHSENTFYAKETFYTEHAFHTENTFYTEDTGVRASERLKNRYGVSEERETREGCMPLL